MLPLELGVQPRHRCRSRGGWRRRAGGRGARLCRDPLQPACSGCPPHFAATVPLRGWVCASFHSLGSTCCFSSSGSSRQDPPRVTEGGTKSPFSADLALAPELNSTAKPRVKAAFPLPCPLVQVPPPRARRGASAGSWSRAPTRSGLGPAAAAEPGSRQGPAQPRRGGVSSGSPDHPLRRWWARQPLRLLPRVQGHLPAARSQPCQRLEPLGSCSCSRRAPWAGPRPLCLILAL